MGYVVITGSQSRLGLAIRKRLEESGREALGVDLPGTGADVEVDLLSAALRTHALQRLEKHCGASVDGLVCGFDLHEGSDAEIVATNYFGTVDMLAGLRGLVSRGRVPAAVAGVSNAALVTPGIPEPAIAGLLNGDEKSTLEILKAQPGRAYAASHLAVTRWVRRNAPLSEWAGRGITLNGVAAGPLVADTLTRTLENPLTGWWNLWASMMPPQFAAPFLLEQGTETTVRDLPRPRGHHPTPEQAAELFEFLLGENARFLVGQIIAIDGGIDAALRPDDWPAVFKERSRLPEDEVSP
jgi:NAD(P)-dependent dehydrogenase (short-subunit alcohol dehydrogenase family)